MKQTNEPSLFLEPGERGVIIGQTGSGKTVGAIYHLRNTTQSPVIVLDTKEDDAFLDLHLKDESLEVFHDIASFIDRYADGQLLPNYMIIRPSPEEMSDVTLLDSVLMEIYKIARPAFVYIDEGYQLHNQGRPGAGLIALLTRGRSKRISTLIGAQRPAWISRFCFTECQHMYIYRITDHRDVKTIAEHIPNLDQKNFVNSFAKKQHMWYYYNIREGGAPVFYNPVPYIKPQRVIDQSDDIRWI